MRGWTRLAETVALFNGNLKSFVYCFDEFLGQRCSPAVDHTEAGKIIFVDDRVLPKQQDYRRNHVCECYFVILNSGTKLLHVEFWHHDQREATVETLAYQTIQACKASECLAFYLHETPTVNMVEGKKCYYAITIRIRSSVPGQVSAFSGFQHQNV